MTTRDKSFQYVRFKTYKMRNVIKLLFLFFTITISSCQKCNDCQSLSKIINDLDGDGVNEYRVDYQCTSQGNGPILCFFC